MHDWIYKIVIDVCYDRDYLYACFIRHFSRLMNDVLTKGTCSQSGEYEIKGMKSNKDAHINWQLERRIDWMGSNSISFDCKVNSLDSGIETMHGRFDMSTGDSC
ncbi:MAG: hypothetical protein DRP56_09460 [Planctomycetota bacterium]|nr:MAG: hypothetical protein DRP56_09460 [Planctomycetota bacterium]